MPITIGQSCHVDRWGREAGHDGHGFAFTAEAAAAIASAAQPVTLRFAGTAFAGSQFPTAATRRAGRAALSTAAVAAADFAGAIGCAAVVVEAEASIFTTCAIAGAEKAGADSINTLGVVTTIAIQATFAGYGRDAGACGVTASRRKTAAFIVFAGCARIDGVCASTFGSAEVCSAGIAIIAIHAGARTDHVAV